jgi:hypothetical protein
MCKQVVLNELHNRENESLSLSSKLDLSLNSHETLHPSNYRYQVLQLTLSSSSYMLTLTTRSVSFAKSRVMHHLPLPSTSGVMLDIYA